MTEASDPMWCVVMFDLPVKTKSQRRHATGFRNLLLDLGFLRAQYSVYVMYLPRAAGAVPAIVTIRSQLPPGGEVRIVHVTDRQWSKGIRFSNGEAEPQEPEPQQLTIF